MTSIAMTSDSLTNDTQCFSYDHLQDLTEAWTPTGTCASGPSSAGLGGAAPYWDSYTVDPATGNRTSETLHGAAAGGVDVNNAYYYPAAGASQPHALQSMQQTVGADASTSNYGYDADGNTTTRPGQTITYDPEGRVASICDGSYNESDICDSSTESDFYDAAGNLLLQTDSATGSTLFDGPTDLHLDAGSSTATATRIYSANGKAVAERTTAAGVSGSVLSWLVPDAQDTVNLEVDAASGSMTYRAQDPFGNSRGTPPAAWSDDRGFLDAPTSTFSGLTQLGARAYDSSIGRFLSVDPVLDPSTPQQNNGYSYAHNSPIDLADPDGLSAGCISSVCHNSATPSGDGGGGGGGGGGGTPPAPAGNSAKKHGDQRSGFDVLAGIRSEWSSDVDFFEGFGQAAAATGIGIWDASPINYIGQAIFEGPTEAANSLNSYMEGQARATLNFVSDPGGTTMAVLGSVVDAC